MIGFVLDGLELGGLLLLLDSSVGSAVDSRVAGDLRDRDAASSIGDCWQDC